MYSDYSHRVGMQRELQSLHVSVDTFVESGKEMRLCPSRSKEGPTECFRERNEYLNFG